MALRPKKNIKKKKIGNSASSKGRQLHILKQHMRGLSVLCWPASWIANSESKFSSFYTIYKYLFQEAFQLPLSCLQSECTEKECLISLIIFSIIFEQFVYLCSISTHFQSMGKTECINMNSKQTLQTQCSKTCSVTRMGCFLIRKQ